MPDANMKLSVPQRRALTIAAGQPDGRVYAGPNYDRRMSGLGRVALSTLQCLGERQLVHYYAAPVPDGVHYGTITEEGRAALRVAPQ